VSQAEGEATPAPATSTEETERPGFRLPPQLRGLRAAFIFLTRIAVGGFPYSAADFAWAPAYFPLVGLVIGSAGAAVLWGTAPLGQGLSAALAITATVWLTGSFHEDGLADTADALGGAHGQKRILDILKDSRIGAYGAVAIALSLMLRALGLIELGARSVIALPLAHTLARTGPVWLMALLPYVSGPDSKGSSVARGGKLPQATVASAFALAVCAAYAQLGWLDARSLGLSLLASLLAAVWLGRKFMKRAGGITGDFLGALEQVTELAVLLALLAAPHTAKLL
jgi:adenosylcobinamide-GDP ribazoletransferase